MSRRAELFGSGAGNAPAQRRSADRPTAKTRHRVSLAAEAPRPPADAPDNSPMPISAAPIPRTLDPDTLKRRLAYADILALGLGVLLALVIQNLLWPVPRATFWTQVLLAVASIPIWLALAASTNLYVARAITRFREELRRLVVTDLLWIASMSALAFVVEFDEFSRRWMILVFVLVLVVQVVERLVARSVFHSLRRAGRMSRRVVIVGTDAESLELAQRLQRRPELGYRVVGFVGDTDPHRNDLGLPVLGDLRSTPLVAQHNGATGVMISLSAVDGPTVNSLTRRLSDVGLHVTLCSSLSDIDIHRLRFQEIDRQTLVYIEPVIRTGWRRVAQHVFDYGIAIAGLLLTAPVLILSAIAIRLETPGPILFRQRRVGQNGREFEMLKLRTMVQDAEAMRQELLERNESDGPLFKIRNDPRITRVGRVLRKFSIDELPQFWNVVRGEMSVCGPRPALSSEVAQWDPDVFERLRVLPGITGMWQVSGRSDSSFEEYKRSDLYYVDNWTLSHDVRIVWRTIGVVLTRRGAS